MRYRVEERGQYEPPACPGCLRRLDVDWLDATCFGDLPDRYYMPGLTACATPGCRYNPSEQGSPLMPKVEIDTVEWMRQQVARYTYKPGWTMEVHDSRGAAEMVVRYTTIDSRSPNYPVALKAHRTLPVTTDPDVLARHVLEGLIDVERHEALEWFRRDGQLFDDPHADPDRWQCCGGAGPKQDACPRWTCPGCGREHTA